MAVQRLNRRNITLSLDKEVLKRVRSVAAARGLSISAFLAQELGKTAEREQSYQKAKASALAQMDSPLHLGGRGIRDREALPERKNLR